MSERKPLTKEEFDAATEVYLVDGKEKLDPIPEWEEGKYYGSPATDATGAAGDGEEAADTVDADASGGGGTPASGDGGTPASGDGGGGTPASGDAGGPSAAAIADELDKVIKINEGKSIVKVPATPKTIKEAINIFCNKYNPNAETPPKDTVTPEKEDGQGGEGGQDGQGGEGGQVKQDGGRRRSRRKHAKKSKKTKKASKRRRTRRASPKSSHRRSRNQKQD
jgi:hypothetical protein